MTRTRTYLVNTMTADALAIKRSQGIRSQEIHEFLLKYSGLSSRPGAPFTNMD